MATASDIIRRSLRLLRVIDAHEALDATDAQDALETLNAMLAEWHEAGIGLPDYSLATLATELGSDVADREAVAYQLALRLGGEYGKSLMPADLVTAERCLFRLRSRYLQTSSPIPSVYY